VIDRKTDVRLVQIIYNGAEIDLVIFKNGRRIGVECKRADAPTITPSMRIALDNLKLDELQVVYPGEKRYRLSKRVEVVPLAEMVNAK
jgi:predicted AAA+ superfamily ATPase